MPVRPGRCGVSPDAVGRRPTVGREVRDVVRAGGVKIVVGGVGLAAAVSDRGVFGPRCGWRRHRCNDLDNDGGWRVDGTAVETGTNDDDGDA